MSALAVVSLLGGLLGFAGMATPASALSIASAGPLTNIDISPDLNCAVDHVGDSSSEFYGTTACGTLIASGGTLYGPDVIPAGGSASPRTAYTPVSQTSAGTGTSADPFTIVTVVDAGTSGLRLTQTDSYVVGQESYRTDVQVTNTTAGTASAILYKAGDCFLQDSDTGFGAYDSATGAVTCVGATTDAGGAAVPGSRIEQFFPLTAGSSYLEDNFDNVWAAVGTQQPLPNQCVACASDVDNGMGLSWSLNIAAQGSTTVSHFTTFSPLGVEPLTTAKTADSATSATGAANGYTITLNNTNATAVTLDTITDSLPSGFAYTTGSSTGATTSDPAVSGQDLTWAGPLTVPASGSLSLHFGVTVSSTPGQYLNNAGATSSTLAVAPTGPTAEVTVTGEPPINRTLTVGRTGSGTGAVSSSPAGIDCGTTCSGTFPVGTAVTLTATPAAGSTFTGWTGGGCTGTGTCVTTLTADTTITANFDTSPPPPPTAPYVMVARDGGVFAPSGQGFLGTARLRPGDGVLRDAQGRIVGARGTPIDSPVVAIAYTPNRQGYWLAQANGGVIPIGNAPDVGNLRSLTLRSPIVGAAATNDGTGLYLVAADGGIFALGTAPFKGSLGGAHLNKPIVAMSLDADGSGYLLTASDGGVFTFDATFRGSLGATRLDKPIVGMAVAPAGGYILVASDGGAFTYGVAFAGSLGGVHIDAPVVGIALDPDGTGYWMAGADGGVFSFDAEFFGSVADVLLQSPITGIVAL